MSERIPHLSEVSTSMLAALGVPDAENSLGFRPVRRACVLLIDGLGWQLLNEHAADAPFLAGLAAEGGPLRIGVPATTSAGLAAVGTGVPSGEHGMVGYSFALPGVGVLNALRWCAHGDGAGADWRARAVPEEVQPRATVFERAERAGVASSVVSAAEFAGSGLTRALLRGGRYVGVFGVGDLAAGAVAALADQPSFCYAYHADLDKLGHLYGPGSHAWRMQLRVVDRLVESIAEDLPAGSLLAVVADHGMVRVAENSVDIDAEPRLRSGVRAIAGEVRVRQVYAERGARLDVLDAWREVLGARAWVLSGDEAVEEGWFGPRVTDEVRPRIGDVVAAGRDEFGMLRREAEPMESMLVGHHGSLTPHEQLVPLLSVYR